MGGGPPAYQVTKAALNALTRTLAGELLETRILVNAMCPGWVATEMGGAGGRPVEDGAAGIIWAATLPDGGPTGGFFRDGRRCRGETFVIDMASPNSSLNKATETGITS